MEAAGQLTEDEKAIYALAKVVLPLGATDKLSKNGITAMRLAAVAKQRLNNGHLNEAGSYAAVATKVVPENHAAFGLILLNMLEVQFMSARAQGVDKIESLISTYQRIVQVVEFHWGVDHPILFSVHDKMVLLLSKADRSDRALDFLQKSLSLAKRILGSSHAITAGYMTKVG